MLSMIESKNPLIRMATLGRVKRMVATYQDKKLKTLDKRLISGLFKRKLKDFDDEERDFMLTSQATTKKSIMRNFNDPSQSFMGDNSIDFLN